PSLLQIGFRPMHTVGEDGLPSAWQQLAAVLLGKPQLVGKKLHCLRDTNFLLQRYSKHRRHQGLIIRKSHPPLRPRVAAAPAVSIPGIPPWILESTRTGYLGIWPTGPDDGYRSCGGDAHRATPKLTSGPRGRSSSASRATSGP